MSEQKDSKSIWDELRSNANVETGFEERHEARRYRQIDPYVNQMGGWANFSSWMVTHARAYFESFEKLKSTYDSQSQVLQEKDQRIAELEKALFGRATHADVMEHKATKANALLREKDAEIQRLRDALLGAITEAQNNLGLYVRSYKKEPFETGILLDIHVKESSNRIERYKLSLSGEVGNDG